MTQSAMRSQRRWNVDALRYALGFVAVALATLFNYPHLALTLAFILAGALIVQLAAQSRWKWREKPAQLDTSSDESAPPDCSTQPNETALQELLARRRAIFQSSLDCIVTLGAEGRITDFNPAAERTTGHTRNAVVGRDFIDVLIPP